MSLARMRKISCRFWNTRSCNSRLAAAGSSASSLSRTTRRNTSRLTRNTSSVAEEANAIHVSNRIVHGTGWALGS